jgi:HEAT repeat protein
MEAVIGLGDFCKEARSAIPQLIKTIKKDDEVPSVRGHAAQSLARIAFEAHDPSAIPVLVEVVIRAKPLEDEVRMAAANALWMLRDYIKPQYIQQLTKALDEGDIDRRMGAAMGLGALAPYSRDALPYLIKALRKVRFEHERAFLAMVLGRFGSAAKEALPDLIQGLRDAREPMAKAMYLDALGRMGLEAKDATRDVLRVLREETDSRLRAAAATVLPYISGGTADAVPDLIRLLDKVEEIERRSGVVALGMLGREARPALSPLLEKLRTEGDEQARTEIIGALGTIAVSMDTEEALPDLRRVLEALEEQEKAKPGNVIKVVIAALRTAVKKVEELAWARRRDRFFAWVSDHPWVIVGVLYVPAWLALWGLLLWLRPDWLLLLNEELRPYTDVPIPRTDYKVPLRALILLKYFHYRPRVLDAWVRRHIDAARSNFENLQTVEERRVRVASPVSLNDGDPLPDLVPANLRTDFSQGPCRLLLAGEGGCGKTSLACKIGQWAMADDANQRLGRHLMLPVLVEHDFAASTDKDTPSLLQVVAGQLQALTGAEQAPADELLEHLLRKRRVLVIVDHFSEMSETTRRAVRPGTKDFPVNALIVTSRSEEELATVPRLVLKPLLVQNTHLSAFLENYLKALEKFPLFQGDEFFQACGWLSKMLGGSPVTALWAKQFADQLLEWKQGVPGAKRPEDFTGLVLGYLNSLNRTGGADKPPDAVIHRRAKLAAYLCVRRAFRSGVAPRDEAVRELGKAELDASPDLALAAAGVPQDALIRQAGEKALHDLESRLRLVRIIPPGQVSIRFSLDPLAEHLAARYYTDTLRGSKRAWRALLRNLTPDMHGFLVALRQCCAERAGEIEGLGWVASKLDAWLSPPLGNPT